MSRVPALLAAVLATAGDAWDGAAGAMAATPRRVRAALAVRRHRRAALIGAALTLLVYLLSTGDLAVSGSGRFTGAPVLRAAPEQLLRVRAPYLFEPVLAWHPSSHLAVFVSPVNLLLGATVAALVGCNIAVAAHTARRSAACRRTRYARLVGVLPAFLLGFACCAPAFLLVLGTGTAAALLPAVLPARPLLYPLALLLLTGTLVWGASRGDRAGRAGRGAGTTRTAGRAGRTGRRARRADDIGDPGTPAPPGVPGTREP
ncbi:hypothetical protein [Streptomyces tirandamycinicus]|uniref:Uncharacterized protein n=1 Tax=Streptomyces tirandamycinicus TaxID=2174846 RepID=A0A2S1T0N9_9ACTN|nr:hypothetical protein [Streptomyces tirandamycinicus]AWI32208.1 hypothetical protein DDW44_27945 [Streptomyces tirandamycinicus]